MSGSPWTGHDVALLYLAATWGEDRSEKWTVLDTEEQADAWQLNNPTGVVWPAEVEVDD